MDELEFITLILYVPVALLLIWIIGCIHLDKKEWLPPFIRKWIENYKNEE